MLLRENGVLISNRNMVEHELNIHGDISKTPLSLDGSTCILYI